MLATIQLSCAEIQKSINALNDAHYSLLREELQFLNLSKVTEQLAHVLQYSAWWHIGHLDQSRRHDPTKQGDLDDPTSTSTSLVSYVRTPDRYLDLDQL